jgi:hypothetical protein
MAPRLTEAVKLARQKAKETERAQKQKDKEIEARKKAKAAEAKAAKEAGKKPSKLATEPPKSKARKPAPTPKKAKAPAPPPRPKKKARVYRRYGKNSGRPSMAGALDINTRSEGQPELIEDHQESFALSSTARDFWGRVVHEKQTANAAPRFASYSQHVRKKARGGGLTQAQKIRMLNADLASLVQDDEDEEERGENAKGQSPLLDLPPEIMDKILDLLPLRHPDVIRVHHDWSMTYTPVKGFIDTRIMLVSKKLHDRATQYLYSRNTFSLWVKRHKTGYFEVTGGLKPEIFQFMTNIVLECHIESWTPNWHPTIARSILDLVRAKAKLHSLTLVIEPRKVKASTTKFGFEQNPITFADFFHERSEVYTSLLRLSCRVLNVVMTVRECPPADWRRVAMADGRIVQMNVNKDLPNVVSKLVANVETKKLWVEYPDGEGPEVVAVNEGRGQMVKVVVKKRAMARDDESGIEEESERATTEARRQQQKASSSRYIASHRTVFNTTKYPNTPAPKRSYGAFLEDASGTEDEEAAEDAFYATPCMGLSAQQQQKQDTVDNNQEHQPPSILGMSLDELDARSNQAAQAAAEQAMEATTANPNYPTPAPTPRVGSLATSDSAPPDHDGVPDVLSTFDLNTFLGANPGFSVGTDLDMNMDINFMPTTDDLALYDISDLTSAPVVPENVIQTVPHSVPSFPPGAEIIDLDTYTPGPPEFHETWKLHEIAEAKLRLLALRKIIEMVVLRKEKALRLGLVREMGTDEKWSDGVGLARGAGVKCEPGWDDGTDAESQNGQDGEGIQNGEVEDEEAQDDDSVVAHGDDAGRTRVPEGAEVIELLSGEEDEVDADVDVEVFDMRAEMEDADGFAEARIETERDEVKGEVVVKDEVFEEAGEVAEEDEVVEEVLELETDGEKAALETAMQERIIEEAKGVERDGMDADAKAVEADSMMDDAAGTEIGGAKSVVEMVKNDEVVEEAMAVEGDDGTEEEANAAEEDE